MERVGLVIVMARVVWATPQVDAPRAARPATSRTYKLLNARGEIFQSSTPGTFGGHRKNRVYGRLDCPAALRALAQGHYVRQRVFFADEATAKAAGYRPCGTCMQEAYRAWKARAPRGQLHSWRGLVRKAPVLRSVLPVVRAAK